MLSWFRRKRNDTEMAEVLSEMRGLTSELKNAVESINRLEAGISNMAADWAGIVDYTNAAQPVLDRTSISEEGASEFSGDDKKEIQSVFSRIKPKPAESA